jgi:hypothetical protein
LIKKKGDVSSLDALNKNHSNENRLNFNAAKQKYKVTKNKLKRQYKNQQGNMMNNLRRKNPKKRIYSDITTGFSKMSSENRKTRVENLPWRVVSCCK